MKDVIVFLTEDKKDFFFVDSHRYDEIKQYEHFRKTEGYIVCSKDGKQFRLTRIINRTPVGLLTDHRNLDLHDYSEENLRTATKSQNAANSRKRKNCSSRFKGVTWNDRGSCWVAQLGLMKSHKHLGSFWSEVEAALVYDDAARKQFGEFAKLNFPNRTK